MIRCSVLAGVLALCVPAIVSGQSALKIAYVDSEALIKQAPGYAEANEAFNRTAGNWRDSLEQKRTHLQTLFDEYKKQEVILSPEKKTEKQEELLRLEQEAQQYFQVKFGPEGEANARQAELMQPLIERVNAVIDQVRVEGDYSLIFDLNNGALVAADRELDITELVIQRLRSQAASSR